MSDEKEKESPRPYVVPPPPRDLLVGPQIHVALSIVILALSAISLFTPWYKAEQYKSSLFGGQDMTSSVTLWKTTTKISGVSDLTTSVSNYCWPVMRRVRVMEAFACATTAAALVCVILGIFNAISKGLNVTLQRSAVALSIVSFIFATITCSFSFNVYYWSFKDCGDQSSYHSQLYEPGVGFAFMITAWVLTFFAGLIVANNPTIALDARYIDSAIFLFTLFSFIGVIFSATSTPIQHWFYKDGSKGKAVDVTLWDTKVGNFDWNILASQVKDSTPRADYTCSKVKDTFFIAGILSIIAASFNFMALFWGVLLWQYLTAFVIPGIVFSILGFLVTIGTFVVETIIYKNNWCDGAYAFEKQKFVLGAGYALCAAAFVMMFFASAFSIIAHVGIKKFFSASALSKLHSD